MLKRKYVKRIYVEEPYCDKCGAFMRYADTVYTYRAQYIYKCTNKDCNGSQIFLEEKMPGILRYEFEEDSDV